MSQNIQNTVFREVGLVFESLTSLDSAYRVTALFRELGYELPGGNDFPNFPGLAARVEGIIQAVIKFDQAADDDAKVDALAELALEIVELTEEIVALEQAVSNATAAFPAFVANAPLNELPFRLLDYLIIEYTRRYRQQVHAVMSFLGIFEEIELSADGAIFQPETLLSKIFWDRLPMLISKPVGLFDDVYSWSTDFNSDKFFTKVDAILRAFLLPGGLYEQSPSLKSALGNTTDNLKELRFPILQNAIFPSTYSQFGINATSAEAQGPRKAGFAIVPYVFGAASFGFDLNETFEILFETTASVDAGLGIVIRPGDIEFMTNLFDAPLDAVNLNAQLKLQQRENTGEIILFGASDATRLAIEGPAIKVFVSSQGEGKDVGFEVQLDALRLVVSGGEGDGFLSTILGDGGINAEAGFVLGYSIQQGFYFVGSGGLELLLATHITLGPLEIQGLIIALKIKDGNFDIEGGAIFRVDMGPLQAVVENMGITTTLSFPDGGGNLGPANLALGFKPPTGVGLSIDTGVVKGGGYLYFDSDKEEYAGILELDLNGIVSVKAIGLITTRMPDGSKGFSLLLIITAEFGSPIQLGLGFTLSAVGGLLGLNRTMRLEIIATGIRDGGINSIMFPQNVIENAPRIISDLKRYFPVEEDTFLIGPMVKIGWGTPNLVTVSLGIIIEIPGNIAILGVLKVTLPDEEAAVIVIQVNFMGAIEFDKKRLWFFASLFDSRVLYITLEGQMGLLVGWGDDASFLVSVGGFHPAFNPPPLPFGAIVRIAISILNTDFARIRVEGYFAVTSNSVQFGAAVEIFFGVSAFNIDGHLAFDALFRFSPFYFIISISASLGVKVFGIGLFSVRMRGSLEGPTPWHVEGTGSISLLFFDIDVDFGHTWGNEAETTLPPITVMPLLVDEFQKMENWLAVLPAGNQLLVSLRDFDQGSTDLVLHPVGSLKISQRAVPLGLTIDKVGNQKPSDANRFDVTADTSGIDEKGKVEESFAVGQYFDRSDNELLSARSFEPMKGGLELSVAGEQYHAPAAVKRVVRYDKIIIDTHFKRFASSFFTWFGALFGLFLNGNAVSQSALSYKQQKKLKPFADQVEVGKTLYTVAFNGDNTAFNDDAMAFTSQVQAQDFMKQQIAGDGNLAKQLHVIPQVEMQRAE